MLPPALRGVDASALQEYVHTQFRRLAASLAQELKPDTTEEELDVALSRALYRMGAQDRSAAPSLQLKYWHSCKFLACGSRECALCVNNPNKRCSAGDIFDSAYADNQALKARCDAPIDVELCEQATGEVFNVPGIEVQLSIIDGETYNEASPHGPFDTIVELLRSDEVLALLSCAGAGGKSLEDGHVIAAMQNGRAPLPDVFITDKNDTFKLNEESFSSFRLLAVAVQRDEQGQLVVVDTIAPAVSAKFAVKTQRALNDYHKSEYPHSKDELTKLRYIGAITAQRLKDAKQWLGKDVPFKSVSSVADLKRLMEYADANRQCEAKLLELLNMRGRHKHKWDFLRSLLAEKMVSDDNTPRVWYSADGVHGLLFTCKQAQINFDKPAGLVQRVMQNGSVRVQVVPATDASHQQTLRTWKQQAEEAWHLPGHKGWQVLTEPYEYTNSPGVFITGGNASPLASSGHNATFSDLPTTSQTTTTTTQANAAPDPRTVFASAAHAGIPGASPLPGAAGGSFTSVMDGSVMGDTRNLPSSFTSTRDGSFTVPGSFTSSRPDGSFVDPRTMPGSFTSSAPDGSFTDPRSSDPGSFVSSQRDGSFVSMQGRMPAIGPITGGFAGNGGLPQNLFAMAADQDVSAGAAQSMCGMEGFAGVGFMGTARMAPPRGHTITSGTSRDHRGLTAARSAPEQDMYPVMGPANDGSFGMEAQAAPRHVSMDGGTTAPSAPEQQEQQQQQQQQQEDDQDEVSQLPPGYTDVEFVEDVAVLAALRRNSGSTLTTTKRGRSIPPEASGPSAASLAAGTAPQDKGLYHIVSAGRHLPRHRSTTDDIPSSGNNALSSTAPGGAAADDDEEEDDVFVTAGDGLNGDASPFAHLTAVRTCSTLSMEDTGALSNSFRDSLHLDASMEEQFNQLLAGDPALRRRLRRNESDSFKRMIPDSILDSPTHGPAGSSIDAWLDNGNGTKSRVQGS